MPKNHSLEGFRAHWDKGLLGDEEDVALEARPEELLEGDRVAAAGLKEELEGFLRCRRVSLMCHQAAFDMDAMQFHIQSSTIAHF